VSSALLLTFVLCCFTHCGQCPSIQPAKRH